MSNSIPGNQKHLTLHDRQFIEDSLDQGLSFREIAKFLCKDPTTISKEIRLHRMNDIHPKRIFNNPHNFCTKRFRCKKTNACNKLFICDTKCSSCMKCKGTVFEYLTQWDIRKCMDHINSYPREKLGGMTPYMLALEKYDPDMLRALRLKFVEPDTVNLTPSLLK